MITNGAQHALDVIARSLLARGDVVAMEDPGYLPPRRLFDSLGARVTGVPVDRDGMIIDAVPPQTRLIYVTSTSCMASTLRPWAMRAPAMCRPPAQRMSC